MNFEDYLSTTNCKILGRTEQSQTFTSVRDGEKRFVKKYSSNFDRVKEELAYTYIGSRNLLNIPKLTMVGEDFIEMEFLYSATIPKNREIIEGILKMYTETLNDSKPKGYFSNIDLSKNKLFRRLEYIPIELEKRGFMGLDLLEKSENFINNNYRMPDHYCLVHGDLKSPHVVKTERGVFFIDLALVSIANPWYDLAFLYMERKDKGFALDELCRDSFDVLGKNLGVNREDIKGYLQSAIFYRSLYNVIFALRHRPKKTLQRTIKELIEIATH